MSLRKPPNWYDMDYEQRRAWERQAREVEDLEYERDQARETADRAMAEDRRARAQAREDLSAVREMADAIGADLRATQDELDLCRQWLRENGHWEAFDDWASYRRTE